MAAGDAIPHIELNVANNAYMTIQPGTGAEWCIHNIGTNMATCELYLTDGTNYSKIDSGNGWLGYAYFLTNTSYLAVKNISGSAQNLSYTGVVTK